jgi:adenylate kinase
MQRQVIIIFGAPGAGKGTQSELLSDKLGFFVIEPSKILEKKFKEAENDSKSADRFIEIDGEKFDALQEKENWKNGILCSPPYVTQLVTAEIKRLFDEGENLILAGSPRTVYEAEKITPVLENFYGKENIKIFLLEIKPEETIFRNSNRKICELMRHSILFNKETEPLTICPLDGSKLIKREGLDDVNTIKVRLKEYTDRTFPIFDFFEKKGMEVKKINGEQSVSDVHKDILKSLND